MMMMMTGLHPRRYCWPVPDFNVQWKIVPPTAHLGYELRKIKMLLYKANNMHILWNTFLCLFNCGNFKRGRKICCLPLGWIDRVSASTSGDPLTVVMSWLSRLAENQSTQEGSGHTMDLRVLSSKAKTSTCPLPKFITNKSAEIHKDERDLPENKEKDLWWPKMACLSTSGGPPKFFIAKILSYFPLIFNLECGHSNTSLQKKQWVL